LKKGQNSRKLLQHCLIKSASAHQAGYISIVQEMPLTILLCIVAASFAAVASRNVPSYERQALHDLYLSTNGDEWKYQYGDEGHWNFTDPDVNPCLLSDPWQGLNCSINSSVSEYNYISKIELAYFNLRGSIPDSIGIDFFIYV
jgi:hypothetical protein